MSRARLPSVRSEGERARPPGVGLAGARVPSVRFERPFLGEQLLHAMSLLLTGNRGTRTRRRRSALTGDAGPGNIAYHASRSVHAVETERLTVAPDAVVVACDTGRERSVERALSRRGQVAPLSSPGLTLVRLSRPSASPRAAWSALLAACPDASWIAPVLRDSSGHELFPTGAVNVRFHEQPDDKRLAAFARDNGLTLERRNEFVLEQATFRPLRPRDTFLPELVDRLAEIPQVAVAWASTASHYRHADGRRPPERHG